MLLAIVLAASVGLLLLNTGDDGAATAAPTTAEKETADDKPVGGTRCSASSVELRRAGHYAVEIARLTSGGPAEASRLVGELRLEPSRMMAHNCLVNAHFEEGGTYEGVLCTPRDDGCRSVVRTRTETSDGRNIRRVDVKRGRAVVASFYLAVMGHPGGKKRADTAADIEVPAQLLRDLFDGKTHMDALEIDADALESEEDAP